MRYQFIKTHTPQYRVTEICECLEVKPSGYYAWKTRKPSPKSIDDAAHGQRIKELQTSRHSMKLCARAAGSSRRD